MKIKLIIFSICFSLFSSIYSQNNTRISGTFLSKTDEKNIILENFITPNSFSKKIEVKNNNFELDFKCEKEDIYKLKFNDKNFIALVIKPKDNIKLKINSESLGINPDIKGSEQSKRLYFVESNLLKNQNTKDSLGKLYQTIPNSDTKRQKEIEQEYFIHESNANFFISDIITRNIDDFVNLFFIERLSIDNFLPIYISLDSALYPIHKGHPAIDGLHKKVNAAKTTSIGSIAPDIKLPTPKGDSINLYSIKGEIIILDFWASWCRPCRMENPNMVKLYSEFYSKGLQILGVSLDKEKAAWIKAISDDNLSWQHISDLKFWQSSAAQLYGVFSIPNIFILDKNYKIIAKKLHGEDLRTFIAERLK